MWCGATYTGSHTHKKIDDVMMSPHPETTNATKFTPGPGFRRAKKSSLKEKGIVGPRR